MSAALVGILLNSDAGYRNPTIRFHLASCHEGDNHESSSELRASLSELPPNLTMLVGGRGFRQAATSHLHG